MQVEGKIILLTGAAGGLGSAMATLLTEHGAQLYLLDTNVEKGRELSQIIVKRGGKAQFEAIDVTVPDNWKRVVDRVFAQCQRIDVLINTVGINIRKGIEEMELDEWETMMRVNVASVFLGIKHMLPIMRKQHNGSIINISSICGLIGHRYTPEAYSASKGAVTILTKSVAARYGRDGVRCNSIHPSTVDTPMTACLFQDLGKKQERLDEVPLGRLATPDDVANAVLFLCAEESAFINGISLPVDGGTTCW